MAEARSRGVRQEIGIRIALGAEPRQVLGTIGRHALAILAPGLAAGVLGALAVSTLVGDFLVNVSPTDAITYLTVSTLLAAVAGLAAYVPARRATRIEPIVALRCE
jgi:putative ABC transport system permease protein